MQLVLFTHPDFGMHQSMPRYSDMLVKGMEVRGHDVVVWKPKARVFLLPAPQSFKKWLGYIDQYLIFPLEIRFRLKSCTDKTVFVFTDHALGPWVPLLKNRPHVIHCHDFLAQKSALGEINENPVSWTGKQYQKYIRRGYSTGKNFISVSNQTRKQLHEMLHFEPECSQVVYNSVNPIFQPMEVLNARKLFGKQVGINIENGFILHVGGNQWYKNRAGVIEIYNAWRLTSTLKLPLILIGEKPSEKIFQLYAKSPFKEEIHFLTEINDEKLKLAYAAASMLLFPSIAEGFGWPLVEAMASGCPVITTNEAPMTEVADKAGFYISKKPTNKMQNKQWSFESAYAINFLVSLSEKEHSAITRSGILNSKRFSAKTNLDSIEDIYTQVLQKSCGKVNAQGNIKSEAVGS